MRLRPMLPLAACLAITACQTPPKSTAPAASAAPASSPVPALDRDALASMTTAGAPAAAPSPVPSPAPVDPYPMAPSTAVKVTERGFEPPAVNAKRGQPMAITFTRTTDKTCATEAVFPWLGGLEVKLPKGKPVRVSFKPEVAGDLKFACGMHMIVGKIVVLE